MGNGYFGGIYFGQYWWPLGSPVKSTQDIDGSYMLIVDLNGEYAVALDLDGLYAPTIDLLGEVES